MKRDSQGRFVSQKSQVAQAQPVAKVSSDPVAQVKDMAKQLVGFFGVDIAEAVEKKIFDAVKDTEVYQKNRASLLALYTQLGMTKMAKVVADDMLA